MLQVKNRTPLAVAMMLAPDASGVDTCWATIKGTFTLEPEPRLAEEQLPVAREPVHVDDPETTSMRIPTELGLAKPGTDVLVDGHAVAPNGRPIVWMDVEVAVGALQQRARVFGDRWWHRQPTGYVRGDAVPFETMPLLWERAYGGRSTVPDGVRYESANPIGAGYRHPDAMEWPDAVLAANIEEPESPVTSLGTRGKPVGFLPIGAHWQPRPQFAGTYDESWQQKRAPYLPHDFDPRFLQVAPPALTAGRHFVGGEPIQLTGFSDNGYLMSQVPTFQPEVEFAFGASAEARPVVIDTVRIEPDQRRFTVCWHAFVSCDKRALKLTEVRVRAEGLT